MGNWDLKDGTGTHIWVLRWKQPAKDRAETWAGVIRAGRRPGRPVRSGGRRVPEEKRLMELPNQGGGTKCMPAILWAESNVTAIPSARLLKSVLTTTVVNPF